MDRDSNGIVARDYLRLALSITWAVFFSAALPARGASQASAVVTQSEYVQWLAHLRPENAPSVGAAENDFVRWARQQGVEPSGGWKPDAPLSREAFAETLAQLLGLRKAGASNPKEAVRALEMEGIFVPEAETVTRATLASVVVGIGFQSPTAMTARSPGGPTTGQRRHDYPRVPGRRW